MTSALSRSRRSSQNSRARADDHLLPGGWGDRLIFGYMFRVVIAVAGVALGTVAITTWGALNNWQMTAKMPWVFGGITAMMVLIGEWLRVAVYEDRVRTSKRKIDHVTEAIVADSSVSLDDIRGSLSYRIIKRGFDILVGLTAIFFLMPLLIAVGLLVRFDSAGPIFFRQKRIGAKGQIFTMYKFRTMTIGSFDESDSSPMRRHIDDELRVTRVGRFLRRTSIDELPQLINIVGGSMTIVGPRPHLHRPSDHLSRTSTINIKPGLSGLHIPGETENEALLDYVTKRSICYDIRIFILLLWDLVRDDETDRH